MEPVDVPLPRYDFYQTIEHLILSLYVKGYGGAEVKDKVGVTFDDRTIVVLLPSLEDETSSPKRFTLQPLTAAIVPDKSTYRVLSTKIELKLAKAVPENWSTLLADSLTSPDQSGQAEAGPSIPKTQTPIPQDTTSIKPGDAPVPVSKAKPKKNWDKLVDEEDDGAKDPNEGGDAALKKFFAQIYGNADDDTKRAMIKSYTESGGTALSTNWDTVGKEKTQIRPPEGMEARKYD